MNFIGKLFGLIFGLAFAGMGVLILSQTSYPTYRSWQAMQSWLPIDAQLLEVRGAENETKARYRYSVDGHVYQNDRVYVATFNDNIGSYHQDLTRCLQNLKNQGRPVNIWYNPDDSKGIGHRPRHALGIVCLDQRFLFNLYPGRPDRLLCRSACANSIPGKASPSIVFSIASGMTEQPRQAGLFGELSGFSPAP
ncbi:DUF3592 domain-containing protein [Thiolapillus sp.]|uniref:DUF3592 domain-containing protein n=1 Tax=Thiolapillus sp. TaxID=2017437 RepID=UPI003AF45422